MFKRLITALFLGLNSGIAFALLNQTTTAYLTNLNLDLALIGLLSLRLMPYSLKWLWAPAVDGLKINLYGQNFGQRKSWILTTQFILFILIFSLGKIDAESNMTLFIAVLVLAVFFAATRDIAMEAYRIELFQNHNPAKGNSFVILGYRLGFFISATVGLYLSEIIGWQLVYQVLACATIPCMVLVFCSEDKYVLQARKKRNLKNWLNDQFVKPVKLLMDMQYLFFIVMIITFYKMSDGFLDAMLFPFLLKIGFTNMQISIYSSGAGNIAYIAGTIIAARIISKFNVFKLMLAAEILAAATNLLFLILIHQGAIPELLMLINVCENFCSGICNIVLITYMSSLCHNKFNATHYAILYSISGLTRYLASSSSGYVAKTFGWETFFIISSLLSIPSLICISYFLYKKFAPIKLTAIDDN